MLPRRGSSRRRRESLTHGPALDPDLYGRAALKRSRPDAGAGGQDLDRRPQGSWDEADRPAARFDVNGADVLRPRGNGRPDSLVGP